jgi:hypothetical protein
MAEFAWWPAGALGDSALSTLEDMAGCADDEIIEKLYNEDDALSDFI